MATDQPAASEAPVELTDVDAVEEFLTTAYGTGMRIRGTEDSSLLRYRDTRAGSVTLNTIEQSADLDFRVEPLNKLVVARMSTARVERTCRGAEQRYEVGQVFLGAYPDQPYTARLLPGRFTNCILDLDSLARVAATAPTRRPGPIRFTSLDARSPAAAAHWWATRSYVAALLGDEEMAASPLVVASATRLLAAVTLATFPNTALTDPTIEDRHDASPRTLRRAIAFLDAHAAEDISVADIAAAARVGVRAVQLAFRRHLDTTPMTYLQGIRLDHAHRDLLAADPARTTVSRIAARWGFANHGRFTAAYRAAYGVLPSSTLRGDRPIGTRPR
ncbi:AraC family transcriptional regulator [Saccharothrix syringae]|uniref:AraC family transcriptional regulator n=1 Tax=Saccharothrix syringae TaxID=103733 RepID=A0A5Q0H273_SACSY|nr:AraC family transcriptional regulator [Saccharothrix syringae]QFZ20025.1 AraC family transcriptional regulator [Saccharothrix syringae]